MIASCESCGEDFLTESDPYVVRPTKNGNKLYCYCHIKGFDEVISKADKLQAENAKLEKCIRLFAFPEGTLEHEAVERVARQCLKELEEE